MTEIFTEMRAIGRHRLLPFQKGIVQSNNALKGLFAESKVRYNIAFILRYRLNQVVLENFFGLILSKRGLYDHPDQLEFRYWLRSYILGRNYSVISDAGNVEVDDAPDIERSEKSLTGIIFSNIKPEVEEETAGQELSDFASDDIENLAGYICHKLTDEVPDIAVSVDEPSRSFSWVNHLTEDGLTKPTEQIMEHIMKLHEIFEGHNKDGLLITQNFIDFSFKSN